MKNTILHLCAILPLHLPLMNPFPPDRAWLEKRITPVIILDKANHISNAILSDLKILFNFEMDFRDRVVILLAGLPQLTIPCV